HRTTGVASSNSSHGSQPPGRACWTGIPGSMSAIAIVSNGAVSTRLSQKRRVISRSSGFSTSFVVVLRGSSAMPQIGHVPGWARTISGCMGHVYSVRLFAEGISGSNAIPQLGHAPGLSSSTSGHIGQTYFSGADWIDLAGADGRAAGTPKETSCAGLAEAALKYRCGSALNFSRQ